MSYSRLQLHGDISFNIVYSFVVKILLKNGRANACYGRAKRWHEKKSRKSQSIWEKFILAGKSAVRISGMVVRIHGNHVLNVGTWKKVENRNRTV